MWHLHGELSKFGLITVIEERLRFLTKLLLAVQISSSILSDILMVRGPCFLSSIFTDSITIPIIKYSLMSKLYASPFSSSKLYFLFHHFPCHYSHNHLCIQHSDYYSQHQEYCWYHHWFPVSVTLTSIVLLWDFSARVFSCACVVHRFSSIPMDLWWAYLFFKTCNSNPSCVWNSEFLNLRLICCNDDEVTYLTL